MIIDFLFFLFGTLAVLSALFMITRKNPVASVMYLIVTLFSLAALFVLLEAHFVAAVQVIVYAGAIMVLFLFVVMLLNLGHEETTEVRGGMARVLGGAFALALVALAGSYIFGETVTRGVPAGETPITALLETRGAIGAIGYPLFQDYLIPFEVTSLLLLVAVIGAIVLARRTAP